MIFTHAVLYSMRPEKFEGLKINNGQNRVILRFSKNENFAKIY